MRLDRLVSSELRIGGRELKRLLASGVVTVDHEPATDGSTRVGKFAHVALGERILRDLRPRYLLLHKPAGYLSATTDERHPTVLELIDGPTDDLHLVGRLDRATTGVLLLTNDGAWSAGITEPGARVPKTYLVETEDPIDPATPAAFAEGIALAGDGVMTRPASLELLGSHRCRLTIHEGRHHQVKRMFAHFENRVVRLHRETVGPIGLDPGMSPGDFRELHPDEVRAVH